MERNSQQNQHAINEVLGPKGSIAKGKPDYELRVEQVEMATTVLTALQSKQHLIVEAGTGVGKSFGYLIPIILNKTPEQPPVMVSTSTISLQEQLIQKDLPFLQKHFTKPFTYALGKGRSNYISLRRLGLANKGHVQLFDSSDEAKQIADLIAWVRTTEEGSLTELSFKPSSEVWAKVQSDRFNCLKYKCPNHKECFYYNSRKKLSSADIVVVNHALLFTDLSLKANNVRLLPKYDNLIIDEAHNMESSAVNHYGSKITKFQFQYLLSQIYNPHKQKGYFLQHQFAEKFPDVIMKCHLAIDEIFDDLKAYFLAHSSPEQKGLRVKTAHYINTEKLTVFRKLYSTLEDCLEAANDSNEEVEIKSFLERTSLLVEAIVKAIHLEHAKEIVYWLEEEGPSKHPHLTINSCPIEIATLLKTHLFEKVNAVIMTSATISIDKKNDGFQHFKNLVGLTNCLTLQTGSPFDYKKNTEIILPSNICGPNSPQFQQSIILAIKHYVECTKGGTFILFTSYKSMTDAYEQLLPFMEINNYPSFCQGKDLNRSHMIEAFKQTNQGILFGTDSFWEGVDIPGNSLRSIIIPRLPFSVPTHPYTQAKHNYIKNQGKQPFKEISLPEAILKLKQGFGRLIRTKDDRGKVIILDNRVHTTQYGKQFIKALPECMIKMEHLSFLES